MQKFNTIDFAVFVSWLSSKCASAMDRWELEDLQQKLDNMLPDPAPVYVDAYKVRDLIRNIADGNKIAAIKTFRDLTGDDLKTAKEAIETVRSNSLYTTS